MKRDRFQTDDYDHDDHDDDGGGGGDDDDDGDGDGDTDHLKHVYALETRTSQATCS